MQLKMKVRVIRGSGTGMEGTVERIDEMTGWFHILPNNTDHHRPTVLEGPFTRDEVEIRVSHTKKVVNPCITSCTAQGTDTQEVVRED